MASRGALTRRERASVFEDDRAVYVVRIERDTGMTQL
jgi:hypothetical protein